MGWLNSQFSATMTVRSAGWCAGARAGCSMPADHYYAARSASPMALVSQFSPKPIGAVAAGRARERLLDGQPLGRNWRRLGRSPMVVATRAHAQRPAQVAHRLRIRLSTNEHILAHD